MVERERRAGLFIASVGSPSGWCINTVRTRAASEMSRLVARVQTINLNRPPDAGRVRPDAIKSFPDAKKLQSGRSTLKHLKTEENSQKSNFVK
jgi:hypothetical protein